MAKFFGVVGYAHEVKPRPGVTEEEIVEREYYGEIVRSSRTLVESSHVHDDLGVNTSISIMADAYASEHFFAIRFVEWAGTLWKVDEVTPQRPRLLLRLGGVYHGSRQPASESP